MNSCSIKLKKEKLPKIINKLEFFLFKAMEQKGMNFYKISQQPKTVESIEILDKVRKGELTKEQLENIIGKKNTQIILTAAKVEDQNRIGTEVYRIAQMVHLLDTVKNSIIPFYINDYTENAKIKEDEGDEQEAKNWKSYVENLQSIITLWDQAVPNFFVFSKIFNLSSKFKFDSEGLIDLNEVADDEEKMVKKMVFDKPSNEIDVLDDVNKAVELFIKSIPAEDVLDEYGFTSLIDYPSFMRHLFEDTENSIGMDELLLKLGQNEKKIPEYKYLIEKLTPAKGLTSQEFQFRIDFRNSFVKALMPILITSIEQGSNKTVNGGTIHAFKITEAASGKVSKYEKAIQTRFTTYGMPVTMPDGRQINLAHEYDGAWVLSKEDIPKIQEYLKNSNNQTKVNFLKAIGFEFSLKTQDMLLNSDYLTGKESRFHWLQNHLIKALTYSKKDFTLNPYRTLVADAYDTSVKPTKKYKGQSALISALIVEELKNNPEYSIEKSVITAEGTQMHSIQMHNNLTVLNKYLSDPEAFPTLRSIIDNEPSMFWLDPETNPSLRKSLFLNSLFYFDYTDMTVDAKGERIFGRRRRVTNDNKYSLTEGEFVKISILNTGGVQLKMDGSFKKDGSSSTSLNEIDKLLQDMHGFMTTKNSNSSVLRLGDKGTDLGMGLNYILDVTTGLPIKDGKPLGAIDPGIDVITTTTFLDNIKNALQDVAEMKYLGKKGFFKTDKDKKGNINHNGLSIASKNINDTWSYFESILTDPTKKLLNDFIAERAKSDTGNVNDIEQVLDKYKKEIEDDVIKYFRKTTADFIGQFKDVFKLGIKSEELLGPGKTNFESYARYYVANTFLTDIEQMKVFFGDAIYFKNFHKRASKDSATGIFTFVDANILEHLNDRNNAQGYGANTNLSARKLIERLYQQKKITKAQRDAALSKQNITKSFKSVVINDVVFNSEHSQKIQDNIKILQEAGFVSPEMQNLFEKNLSATIKKGYKGAKEADGQGKCTFDFYRIMSILTGPWSSQQEAVYQKIVEYNHYDELADEEEDETKKTEYIQKRDAVGYDPTEAVYFPPKKFQYAGPMKYSKIIDGIEYTTAPAVFDKFSLQPLIPTVIKKGQVKTADWHLARKMEFNGVAYVKFESASKVETPAEKDEMFSDYDPNKPNERKVIPFSPKDVFKGEQELFFNHFKEQMAIDAEIHDHAIFGSQIRKLILMNLSRPEFKQMKDAYQNHLASLVELEKTALYNEMGIKRVDGKLKMEMNKMIEYLFTQIAKKDQDSNVKKSLNYDEATGKFDIPLDASVQAQVLEGIIISAINNRIVRYKTNGSMLTQMAPTGTEGTKYNKDASAKALETYGDEGLKYYDIVPGENGLPTVTKMEVKISLTGQWLRLLELNDINGNKINSLERLNEMLLNKAWVDANEKAITMISYRIPTAARNFMDVMRIKEFMPASVGDAIIMPRECIIKSGSDYDIDKMFTFYPNISEKGIYQNTKYTQADLQNPEKYNQLKETIQNKLYETMAEIILHPANYMELVTPSENYHILPIINDISIKLNPGSKERKKTDFTNTEILERQKNIQKFISLLKGKDDLGIAAVANTFNVMYQLANAIANPNFFSAGNNRGTSIKTFFDSANVKKFQGTITGIDFSTIFDEDGVLKSEFFSEFITAFVDVANDDYVFAANIVTELSPIMFYMKYTGMSSKKILNFANQPAIRLYTKNLAKYQNMFVKLNGVLVDNEKKNISARTKALGDTLRELDYAEVVEYNKNGTKKKKGKRENIENYLTQEYYKNELGGKKYPDFFTVEALEKQIQPDGNISKLSKKEKLVQISMLLELENLREQSNSVTEAQKFLNFDTSPFSSTFDVASRNNAYETAIKGNNVLSNDTLKTIKENSIISPLDVSKDITDILEELFPVRNDKAFNEFLIKKTAEARNNIYNPAIISQDDEMKMARTAKNDFLQFILQNYIGKSEEGMKFFHETFGTEKGFNDYMTEMVQTNKLLDMYRGIKDMTRTTKEGDVETIENIFEKLGKAFPFVRNVIVERGENNPKIITWKIVENGSNIVEKESVISQFDELCNLTDPEDKPIRDFFRNLALYSTFQSGLNTSDNSYTNITPIDLINKLFGYSVSEYTKNNVIKQQKEVEFDSFFPMFINNNPSFFTLDSNATPTNEISSKGKWYAKGTPLVWIVKVQKPEEVVIIPVIKNAIINPVGGVKVISQDDVAAYHTYLQKSNDVAPKEFFTSNTTFKEFYNTNTGKRERAPQSSKWVLQENGLYNLVDKNGGELYIENVDLRTGIKMVAPAQPVKQQSTKQPTSISKPVVENVVEGVKNIPNTGLTLDQGNKFISILQSQIGKQEETTSVMPKKPFEVKSKPPSRDAQGNLISRNEVISKFREEFVGDFPISDDEILRRYQEEYLSGETLKEFLERISC